MEDYIPQAHFHDVQLCLGKGGLLRILYMVDWPTPEEVVLEIPGRGKLWIKVRETETS